jgi:pimeloyl-ACP methyl ester carboxylesterase
MWRLSSSFFYGALILLVNLSSRRVQAFSTSPLRHRRHSHQRNVLTTYATKPSTATKAGLSAASEKGFFWEFLGYPCYAEVAKPPSTNSPWGSVLPGIESSSAGSTRPVILLVHGFGCSTVYWRETKKYLTQAGYTVHAVDLLGQGKSFKAGRSSTPPIEYSISLWAQMIDEYARRYIKSDKVVLVGNSIGSLVGLSATTGDWYQDLGGGKEEPYLPSKVQGLCFFNCGVGMNTRNVLKTVPEKWQKYILSVLFYLFDSLIFANKPLLTYLVDNQVTKETLRNALLGLYTCADDPLSRVDDELVDSFFDPVINDETEKIVEVISQIYLNDAGKTPMEFHEMYFSGEAATEATNKDATTSNPFAAWTKSFSKQEQSASKAQLPIHLIWGDTDPVSPISGDVGTFYTQLATSGTDNSLVDVSMQVIRAGHIPFDERPECNEGLVDWLGKLGQTKMARYQVQTTPSFPKWPL